MTEDEREITVKLPKRLADALDETAVRSERTRDSIVRAALGEWLTEDKRRHELTLESINDFNEGRFLSHEQVRERMQEISDERRRGRRPGPA